MHHRWEEHPSELELHVVAASEPGVFEEAFVAFAELVNAEGTRRIGSDSVLGQALTGGCRERGHLHLPHLLGNGPAAWVIEASEGDLDELVEGKGPIRDGEFLLMFRGIGIDPEDARRIAQRRGVFAMDVD